MYTKYLRITLAQNEIFPSLSYWISGPICRPAKNKTLSPLPSFRTAFRLQWDW